MEAARRDHPEKKIDFTVSRNKEIIHVPVTPELAADGTGRIGVSLGVNAKIVRKAAKGPGDALRLAGTEFGRLTGLVVGGASLLNLRLKRCMWRIFPGSCAAWGEGYL